LSDFGYKTNKNGIAISTNFEYLRDLNLGIGGSSFHEKIETDSSASDRQKKMKGEYWDTFTKFSLDYDKRNQKFKTSKGFRSFYSLDLPLISNTNTLTNSYSFKHYTELYEENITTTSFLIRTANSLTNEDIKLSERLFVPSKRLRGFEYGKIGPKDGNDFVGGNFLTTFNFNSTIPQLFPNAQNFDFLFFFDVANIWGVDYDSSLDTNNDIRSAAGIAVDWMTPVGPLNFSLAQPLSKSSGDITESFRFNLGTTF
jgi:outer membrane protein insertion porin family